MRSKIVSSIVLVAALFSPFAFAQNPLPAATAQGGSPTTAPARGTLYRVEHLGNTAYLFGTIHVGQPNFYPLEPQVTHALAKAAKLVVELDVRNSEAFQGALAKHGVFRPGTTLREHISAESFTRLQQALQQFGLAPERVLHMKPWLVANLLLGLDLERHGYQRSHGLEFYLLARAGEQAKPVLELESAEYQLSLFDGMPPAEQEHYLRECLDELADGSALRKARRLIDAWSAADAERFDALLRESLNENTKSSQFIHRVLLDKRNPAMAAKIEGLLKTEQATFVGVGLLHLLGEGGVPALLKQRGYRVERLY